MLKRWFLRHGLKLLVCFTCVCVCETCFASGCNTGSKHKIFLSGIDALGNVGKIWRPERGLRMVSGFESWEKGLFSKVASNSVLTTLWEMASGFGWVSL